MLIPTTLELIIKEIPPTINLDYKRYRRNRFVIENYFFQFHPLLLFKLHY